MKMVILIILMAGLLFYLLFGVGEAQEEVVDVNTADFKIAEPNLVFTIVEPDFAIVVDYCVQYSFAGDFIVPDSNCNEYSFLQFERDINITLPCSCTRQIVSFDINPCEHGNYLIKIVE